jgi:hypothetical protein
MTRQFETPQLGLFAEDQSCVVLKLAQKVALTKLMEVLLFEIATALANGGIGDDQDHA